MIWNDMIQYHAMRHDIWCKWFHTIRCNTIWCNARWSEATRHKVMWYNKRQYDAFNAPQYDTIKCNIISWYATTQESCDTMHCKTQHHVMQYMIKCKSIRCNMVQCDITKHMTWFYTKGSERHSAIHAMQRIRPRKTQMKDHYNTDG